MQTFLSQISSHNHKLCFYFHCQLKASSTLGFFLSLLQHDYIKVIAQVQTCNALDVLHLCSKMFCFPCTLCWSEPRYLTFCQPALLEAQWNICIKVIPATPNLGRQADVWDNFLPLDRSKFFTKHEVLVINNLIGELGKKYPSGSSWWIISWKDSHQKTK